jgi:cell division transport system permease protein
VDQVVADFEWSQRLRRWIRFGDRVMAVIAIVLGAAVAFIVGHLIRLQVVSRRQEIEVSQLVGATASGRAPALPLPRPSPGRGRRKLGSRLGMGRDGWLGAELGALTTAYALT